MSLATYTFTSLVRRGFTPNAAGSASVTVHVEGQADIDREVPMMSPAEVIHKRFAVARTSCAA